MKPPVLTIAAMQLSASLKAVGRALGATTAAARWEAAGEVGATPNRCHGLLPAPL